jgi:hypothetical protein
LGKKTHTHIHTQAGQAAEGQAFDQSYADQPGYVPEVPPPPSGKGDGYSWASDELRMLLRIPLPPNSKAKSVNVDVTPTTIKVVHRAMLLLFLTASELSSDFAGRRRMCFVSSKKITSLRCRLDTFPVNLFHLPPLSTLNSMVFILVTGKVRRPRAVGG